MPFPKWAVEPVFLSRKNVPPDKSEPGNFYPVTQATLVNCLRQLASVVKIADQIFHEIGCECRVIAERSERLQVKINSCEEVVSKLNARAVKVPVSDLSATARLMRNEKPYSTQYEQSSQFFLPSTRPPCIDGLYGTACTTPVAVICTIDRYRSDGLSSSDLFMVTPVLGGARKKRRKLLDIETRKPANFSLDRVTQDLIECGSSSLSPVVSPSRGYILKQNENLELERLPSPEEQTMLVSLEYPSTVVPVDTSGRSFNRMSLLRRSLIHADFIIKRKKSKKKSKRRHTFCEGENREIEQAIRNVTHSSCQTDDHLLDTTSLASSSSLHRSLSKRRSRSVQDNSRRKLLDDTDLDSLKQDSKDSATEEDKSPTKSSVGSVKKSKGWSYAFNPISSLSAAISIAAVKMRSSSRGGKGDDGRSSSGNWSASSSTRASVDSDHQHAVSSPSRNSVGKDSLLSDAPLQHDNRSRDDILHIQSLTCSPVKKKKFASVGLSWEANNGRTSNTPTPDFTSVGSSSTPVIRSPCAGRRGVSDDGDSSVYSVDTDGYYTSMHTDSGLWCNVLKREDVLAGLRQRKESQSSVSTVDNSSINSFLSKSATECSSNSGGSLKGGPKPPPRVSSAKSVPDLKGTPGSKPEGSDTSCSPHPPNGSTSESEHEVVRDRIRLKTAITRYPSMCAVSPETSDDEIGDYKRRTVVANPNLNVVVAEVHRADVVNPTGDSEDDDDKTSSHDVPSSPSRLFCRPPPINMYRSETPVPSNFSAALNQNQLVRTSTPRSGVNVTTFSPDLSDNRKTTDYDNNRNRNEIIVTEKPISPLLSDKTLIPLKYAQRITVTPIARSDSNSGSTGTIKRTPLKQLSSNEPSKTDKPSLMPFNKQDGSPSYVSFKAPDSPVSVASFKLGSEGKVSSPTGSLTRPVARVTLDPTGKVVYSSNSLERPSSVSPSKSSLENRPYATIPKYQHNNPSTNRSSIPIREVQNSSSNDLKLKDQTDGCDKPAKAVVQQQQPPSPDQSPPPNFSSFRSGKDFTFRPSRGGRFCRSYFPSHLISTPSSNHQPVYSPSSSPVLPHGPQDSKRYSSNPSPIPPQDSKRYSSNPSPIPPQDSKRYTAQSNPSARENSAGQNHPRTNTQLSSLTRNQTVPNHQQQQPPYRQNPSSYVPNAPSSALQSGYSTPNSKIWPSRLQSPSPNNRYIAPHPQLLKTAPTSNQDRPRNSFSSLSPPDLIPSGESPPSTLDITSPASTHKKFGFEGSRTQNSPPGSDKTNLKSMSANELFAIIHSSKKKLNIKSESELSMSPMSSRSASPALSQSSLSKLQPVETGVLSRRYDNSPDRSKWCNSMPSRRQQQVAEKVSPATKQTSLKDFKMLLLQTRTGNSDSSPRPSAAELLKVSPPKSTPSSKLPLPSTFKTPPSHSPSGVSYSGTVPVKRNMRTRSPYLTRYDSAYPPIIEDCSEEMESYEDSNKCLQSSSGMPYSPQKYIKKHEPQPSIAKATSTWV